MNSKLELRNEAVRLAVNVKDGTSENVIEVSRKIETYILGDAELPEYFDTQKNLQEMFATMSRTNSFCKGVKDYENSEKKAETTDKTQPN